MNPTIFTLTFYAVSIENNDLVDFKYQGINEQKAKGKYDSISIKEVQEGWQSHTELSKNLLSRTNKYKFIYDLKDEDAVVEDYPLEDFYDDNEVYELVEQGEPEIVSTEKIDPIVPEPEPEEEIVPATIREILLAEDDNENDFIVEGTVIKNVFNGVTEEWKIVSFGNNGVLLEHISYNKLTDNKGIKEITFADLKDLFIKKEIVINGLEDERTFNLCIKAVKGGLRIINDRSYNNNIRKYFYGNKTKFLTYFENINEADKQEWLAVKNVAELMLEDKSTLTEEEIQHWLEVINNANKNL